MTPLVSILIPCYNAERWVAQALESALAQTWLEKEIIVVDDGSKDASLEIIKRFDGRVRWETGPNRGGNAARNRLLELARGEWLQYLDADDFLLPDKVERQMEFLGKHADTDVIYSRVIQQTQFESGVHQDVSLMPEPLDPWMLLVRWDLPQTGAPLWRKQAIVDVVGWKPNQPCCQEHELYLRLLMGAKKFAYCSDYGAVYRQWSGGSVCTRDPREVHRQRLEIIRRAEDFLRERKELTTERLWAVNQARFEVARLAWHYDAAFAGEIVTVIRCSQPGFVPGGKVAPGQYRVMYQLFGFAMAERLAEFKRIFFGGRQAKAASAVS